MKQLMAGGGVALIGMQLIPLLANLFSASADAVVSTFTSAYAVASAAVTEGAVTVAYEAAPRITEIVTLLPLHMFAM